MMTPTEFYQLPISSLFWYYPDHNSSGYCVVVMERVSRQMIRVAPLAGIDEGLFLTIKDLPKMKTIQ